MPVRKDFKEKIWEEAGADDGEFHPFFPKFLNVGSKHPAVAVLQMLFKMSPRATVGGYLHLSIVVNGVLDEGFARVIRAFQERYGLEPDGNFGPDTRAAFAKATGLDVDTIPQDVMSGDEINIITPDTNALAKERHLP